MELVIVTKPDLNYAMNIKAGMEIQSDTGVSFVTTEDCNFKFSSSYDPYDNFCV